MVLRRSNPWETTDKSGFISIGTHSLHISTSGPSRSPSHPVLILITGGGAPAYLYRRVQSHLRSTIRTYWYDRAGYDHSDVPPTLPITSTSTVHDLKALMAAISVSPPYILLAHSFGGLVARSYLALYPADLAGMILVDTATELMQALYPAIPSKELVAVAKNVDFVELTDAQRGYGFDDEEWEELWRALDRTNGEGGGSPAEEKRGAGRFVAEKRQVDGRVLGDRPLSVVKCDMAGDWRLMYEEGVRLGDGTEEERRVAKDFVSTFELLQGQVQSVLLRMSSNSRFREVDDLGHDAILRRPEIVADEVNWVLQQWLEEDAQSAV